MDEKYIFNPKNWIVSKIKKEGYEVIMQASFSYFCIDSQRLAEAVGHNVICQLEP